MKIFSLIATLFLSACSVFGDSGVEEAQFKIIEKDGEIEIRQYAAIIAAETVVGGSYEDYDREAFGRLFDYISGENVAAQKIAMTAPVLQEEVSQKIAMTAPVLQEQVDGKNAWKMSFVLPANFTLTNAPQPKNPEVKLVELPAKKIAAIRFSGFLDEENNAAKLAELRVWLKNKGIKHSQKHVSAGYNPPWTIPALRRNEVLIELE